MSLSRAETAETPHGRSPKMTIMTRVTQHLKNAVVGAGLAILLITVGVDVGHALGIDDTVIVLILAFVGATTAGVVGIQRQTRRR
jgi:hypothetical protein